MSGNNSASVFNVVEMKNDSANVKYLSIGKKVHSSVFAHADSLANGHLKLQFSFLSGQTLYQILKKKIHSYISAFQQTRKGLRIICVCMCHVFLNAI